MPMPLSPVVRRVATVLAFGAILAASRVAFADDARSSRPFCAVEKSIGMTESETAAIEDIVCDAARAAPAAGKRHRLHAVRVGAKIVLTVVSERLDGNVASKQLVLTNLEEVTVAAPRLVEAAADQKPVGETVTVTNVVGDETRRSKKKTSELHAWLGMVAASSPRIGTGGGVSLGISAGADRWSFVGDLRLAGESFNQPAALALKIFTLGSVAIEPDSKFAFVSLSGGVRHHFSASDISPFVGMGIGLDYLGRPRKVKRTAPSYGGSYGYEDRVKNGTTGLAGYGEIGLDILRTHAVGGAFVLRVDAPAFTVEERRVDDANPSKVHSSVTYSPIFGAGIAMRF